jgi:hypothetical protein
MEWNGMEPSLCFSATLPVSLSAVLGSALDHEL